MSEVRLYCAAIERAERRETARLIEAVALGAQGTSKSIAAAIKKLRS